GETLTANNNGTTTFFGVVAPVPITSMTIGENSPFWATEYVQAQGPQSPQLSAVPFINQPLVPLAIPPGRPGTTLTINGAGFNSHSMVNWNGTPRATRIVSGTQLTASVSAEDIELPGTAWVTVSNSGSSAQTSNVVFF